MPASSAQSGPAPIPSSQWAALVGSPVRVTLQGGGGGSSGSNEAVTGLVWAYDASVSTLILELPGGGSRDYPASAIAAIGSASTASSSSSSSSPSISADLKNAPSKTSFRVIKERRIKSLVTIASLSGPAAGLKLSDPSKPVSAEMAAARERSAVAEANKRMSRIGVGVKGDAQAIFDALSKTLPCRWHETHIIVMDEIVISDPYTTASVPKYDAATLRALLEGKEPAGVPADAKAKARIWAQVNKVLEGERRKLGAAGATSAGAQTAAVAAA